MEFLLDEDQKMVFTNTYDACQYAEGFGDGEEATEEQKIDAFAYLIKTGACWSLQGWYGRTAQMLVDRGIISRTGEVLREGRD